MNLNEKSNENTTIKIQKEVGIMEGALTMLNTILSLLTLIFNRKQNKKQNNITLYDKRKRVYDFLKDSKFDWESCLKYENNTNLDIIAKQVFAKETLGEIIEPEKLKKIVWKGYKNAIELLEEIENLHKITTKEQNIILKLKIAMNEFNKIYLDYSYINRGEKEKKELIEKSNEKVKEITEIYKSNEFKKLLNKMEEELKIGW